MVKWLTPAAKRFAAVCSLLLMCWSCLADTLAPRHEKRVRQATIEVVVAVPKTDPLTYEKPLPLELLPFTVREATHLPIGTAFCIGSNQYVSAAHVLAAGAGSQLGAPKLRDQTGQLYDIKEILKLSTAEDFVVFSLKNPPGHEALTVNEAAEPNSTVFAVGNALGEGIVIRDGLFTSTTPEQLEGRWNWMRFSAAASPGNSGGPLLDKTGRVIGVVIAKSPNENLNFALPVGRILSSEKGRALFETRTSFNLPYAPESIVFNSSEAVALPLSYDKLAEVVLDLYRRNFDRALTELLGKNAGKFFPKGEESRELFFNQDWALEPRLILRKNTKWEAQEADASETYDLGNGGFFVGGTLADTGIVRMRLPDDIKVKDLVTDSRKFMDVFLKASGIKRFVGSEGVRITSLGPAQQDAIFVDTYQRKWLFRVWNLPFMDMQLISLALPVPEGFAVLSRITPTAMAYQTTALLRMAADLIYITYSGTLERWREYLAITAIQPTVFSGISIEFEPNRFFRYRSPRLELALDTELQNISHKSIFYLNLGYFEDRGVVVWDVAGLHFQEDSKGETWVHVVRHPRPAESLGQDLKDEWERLRDRKKPYDSIPFANDEMMFVETSMTRSARLGSAIDPDAPFIYQAGYAVKSYFPPDVMRSMRNSLLDGLHVLED